ncbi:MAG: aminopeptidase P family N-terminal domain-containing protein [Myxococcota bacterium]
MPAPLALVRQHMAERGLDFFLVPSSDAHQSEYVPGAWQRRAWVTGFTGSMGNAVIGKDGAWLWADSRYWLQAEAELDRAHWSLMMQGAHGVPSIPRFLAAEAEGKVVGYDPRLSSPAEAAELADALAPAGATLSALDENLVDLAWTALGGRPALPKNPITVWPERHAGESVASKLARLREGTAAAGAQHLVLTTLDEIAWAMNIRGTDVSFNPVAIAWAIVSRASATLFIDGGKVGADAQAHLDEAGVRVASYAAFGAALAGLDGKVVVDSDHGNQWILDVPENAGARPVLVRSLVQPARARTSASSTACARPTSPRRGGGHPLPPLDRGRVVKPKPRRARRRHRARALPRRGRALPRPVLRYDCGLRRQRRHRPLPSVAGDQQEDRRLGYVPPRLGRRYLDGTTDITRTVHLGLPTDRQREHYTRVLEGHLALYTPSSPARHDRHPVDAFARRCGRSA